MVPSMLFAELQITCVSKLQELLNMKLLNFGSY